MYRIALTIVLAILQYAPLQRTYWEDLSKNAQNATMSAVIKEGGIVSRFVTRKFVTDDSEQTDSLLNALVRLPKDADKKSYYFHLFNKILRQSDGATAEMVVEYVRQMVLSDVDYVMGYILDHKEYNTIYSEKIAENIYFSGEDLNDSLKMFDSFRLEVMKNYGGDSKRLNDFFTAIRKRLVGLWND